MTESPPHYKETEYGFEYGAASVERTASDRGYVVISVRTKRAWVSVIVTPTGFLRTQWEKGKEPKP